MAFTKWKKPESVSQSSTFRPKQKKFLFPVAKLLKTWLGRSDIFLFLIIFFFFTSTGTDEYTRYACSETSLHAVHNKITDSALLYSTLHQVQAWHRKINVSDDGQLWGVVALHAKRGHALLCYMLQIKTTRKNTTWLAIIVDLKFLSLWSLIQHVQELTIACKNAHKFSLV